MRFLRFLPLICLFSSQTFAEEYFGKFTDGPEGKFITGESRPLFKLTQAFHFEDPNKFLWSAPAGAEVDGASIPQVFWSIIGGPFEGDYLKASIIHDHFCKMKTRTSHDTHRNFYYGMRANGVPDWKAKLMYWAVSSFGPNWIIEKRIINTSSCTEISVGTTCTIVPKISEEKFEIVSLDFSDPEELAISLSKLNAIAKNLKSSNGENIDFYGKVPISADLDNIEMSANSFRDTILSSRITNTHNYAGLFSQPKTENLESISTWLVNISSENSNIQSGFVNVADTPFTIGTKDIPQIVEALDLRSFTYNFGSIDNKTMQ